MTAIPEPWKSFLTAIDETLTQPTRVEILGGFVITLFYGAPRTTSDVDIVSIIPNVQVRQLIDLAGIGSPLHQKYGVYLDRVDMFEDFPQVKSVRPTARQDNAQQSRQDGKDSR